MKPHIKYHKGKWRVWRHRSACPWQLPTVARKDFRSAVQAHFDYVNGVLWRVG